MPGSRLHSTAFVTGCCVLVAIVLWPATALPQQQFRHVFDNSTLDVAPKSGEQFSDAVREFHRTGENAYNGKPDAIEEGKELYMQWCQACHMPDGRGGMGPALAGSRHTYPRITTDKGLFEVVFGGASGAMQPFGLRMTQDEILKTMAFVRTLMGK